MKQIATHEWLQKLIDNKEIVPVKTADIPFFHDGVSAGKFDSSSNETDETMKVFLLMNENPDVMFAVRVRGYLMVDCDYMPGENVLKTHQETLAIEEKSVVLQQQLPISVVFIHFSEHNAVK